MSFPQRHGAARHGSLPAQALQAMGYGVVLIDIRAESQIAREGAIPGALVIARNVLEWRLDPASPYRHPQAPEPDDHVIVLCDQGYQSRLAMVIALAIVCVLGLIKLVSSYSQHPNAARLRSFRPWAGFNNDMPEEGKLTGMTVNRATRAGGGLTALLTLACIVMGATPGAFASKPPRPSASAPASVGPGVRPAPSSIALSNAQVCGAVAAKGGFSYHSYISTNAGSYPVIVVAVAVALAESGCQWNIYLCNPSLAHGYYPPVSCPSGAASYDRGLWQINSFYHHEVSDSCAFQVQCNTAAAFNISKKGHSWSAWTAYNSGAWANYISIAEQAVYGFSFQLENHGDGTCLDADSAQPYTRGKIFQWTCNAADSYQRWKVVGTVGHLPILQNVGTGTCLDADSSQIYNRGKIFQWHCRTTDPYQQWWFQGSGQLNTNGNADAGIHSQGTRTTCLDGDGSSRGKRAPIFQWDCNQSDIYQQWN